MGKRTETFIIPVKDLIEELILPGILFLVGMGATVSILWG